MTLTEKQLYAMDILIEAGWVSKAPVTEISAMYNRRNYLSLIIQLRKARAGC